MFYCERKEDIRQSTKLGKYKSITSWLYTQISHIFCNVELFPNLLQVEPHHVRINSLCHETLNVLQFETKMEQ